MKIFTFILFFTCYFTLFGQVSTNNIKQLKQDLLKEKVDSSKVSKLIKIGDFYDNINKLDSSFYFYNEAVVLAEKINLNSYIAKSNKKLAVHYLYSLQYINSLEKFQKALLAYETLNNIRETADIFNFIGRIYSEIYKEDQAIQFYLKSLNLYQNNLKDKKGVALNYVDIGNLYYSQENYEFALTYFEDALVLYKELKDEGGVANCYTNLGNVYADNNNINEGLKYYFESVKIHEKINYLGGLATNYNNIGDCYLSLRQYKEAGLYFEKALKIAKKNNYEALKIIIYFNLADLNAKENKLNDAISYSLKGLSLSEKIGDLEFQILYLKVLATNYDKLGDFYKSYDYLKKHTTLKDSAFKNERRKNVGLFHALNDLENKRVTINELSTKNELAEIKYQSGKNYSFFLIILVVIFAIFLIISINLHVSRKEAYNLLEFRNNEIKKMNEEIEMQAKNLAQLNTTKDKFFSIIAHDLKNPFNSIQGFTELLIENFKEYDNDKKIKFLKVIKGSSSKASNLLSNLLLWANNQSGRIEFKPTKIDLASLVSESISLLEIQAINKEILLINNIDSNCFVFADENMVDTVIRNLVSNAIKFTYEKGEIQIYSTIVENFVEVTVKDNGIGIVIDDIKNIFNIEIKNTGIGTANEHGSGIGLILCKDFIEKNGGEIWVESIPNVGSEFKFTLPVYNN
ncbi:tetratricopeptide repeat protein [Lutibacter sp.]|uniref:tetratricopeptide repeat-containing sensor histidine kinase n=1 Tax=Lutibacter sp. TaxID=1925666 RepID=UPI003565FA27